MATLAVATLRDVQMGPAIAEYLRSIDDTLTPFEGRFLVHGQEAEEVEGRWPGTLIIIQFPDRQHAHDWYASSAYRAILPLRTEHSHGDVILIDTASSDYQARDFLDKLASK
jgi:uncharacterized protein (DUF1330 family)